MLTLVPFGPACAGEGGQKPPQQAGGPVAGNEEQVGGGEGGNVQQREMINRQSDLYQKPDPLNGYGEVTMTLAEAYDEYIRYRAAYFNDAQKAIHEERFAAEDTDGYRRLRALRHTVEQKLDDWQWSYSDWLEHAPDAYGDLKQAIEQVEATGDRSREAQIVVLVRNAMDGESGSLTEEERTGLREMLRLAAWVSWLTDASLELTEAMEYLEDTDDSGEKGIRPKLSVGPGDSVTARSEDKSVSLDVR